MIKETLRNKIREIDELKDALLLARQHVPIGMEYLHKRINKLLKIRK